MIERSQAIVRAADAKFPAVADLVREVRDERDEQLWSVLSSATRGREGSAATSMIVVDSSALVEVLVGVGSRAVALQKVLSVFRKLDAKGPSSGIASALVELFRTTPLVRHPHTALLARIWQLRSNLTPYDAAYVALAEVLPAPLVTCDGRIAAAPGHRARVEVF